MQLFGDLAADENHKKAVTLIGDAARVWNKRIGRSFGIFFVVSPLSLRQCCDKISTCLEGEAFPPDPGPYKRVAALLVFGVLNPPVRILTVTGQELSDAEKRQWIVRFMALTIPAVISELTYKPGDIYEDLPPWTGFPSDHYKLEFFEWLRRLDDLSWAKNVYGAIVNVAVQHLSTPRLARMVLATTLSLEACHYICMSPKRDHVRDTYQLNSDLAEHMQIDLYYDDLTKLSKIV
ncbi:MAG: hypothetical protein ABL908_14950 [Hyphomicrobium sp.]